MAGIRCSLLVAALALQVTVGGSEFLPKSDYGMHRRRRAHAVERQPRIRARQGGEGRGARALDARDQGHQHAA